MYTAHRHQPRFPQRVAQRGAILMVALIFLILLTLLAIGASSGSLLQQRMVAATRNAQLAQMSADAALRVAEWRIWSTTASGAGNTFVCDAGDINAQTGCIKYDPTSSQYQPGGKVTRFRTGDNQWLSLAGPVTYAGGGSGFTGQTGNFATANIAAAPQYIVEKLGPVRAPGSGPQHESGVTGLNGSSPGRLDLEIYRITARATGGNKNTVRVVESTFDAQTD